MPSETESRKLRLLAEAGVQDLCPDPAVVWEVFKRFAVEPVNCVEDYLLFQAGDSEQQQDTYFDFCREFKQYAAEGAPWYEQLHVEFSTQRPHRLGFSPLTHWSYEFNSVAEFFEAVEQLAEFRTGLTFPSWSFQVYHTGV